MENGLSTCGIHKRINEIFCTKCKGYLCARCIPSHSLQCGPRALTHILHISPLETFQKLDSLIETSKEEDKNVEVEYNETITSLQEAASDINEVMKWWESQGESLKVFMHKFTLYEKLKRKRPHAPKLAEQLLNDKNKLKESIQGKKTKEVVELTMKIDRQTNLMKSAERGSGLVERFRDKFIKFKEANPLSEVIASAKLLDAKCSLLNLKVLDTSWKIDRTFQSHKMYISADGLTYGCNASDGYPGIIGTADSANGSFAYEVIPENLCCTYSEGFGIIERAAYLTEYQKDSVTPSVSSSLIGFAYSNEVINMECASSNSMEMGSKYYVKVDVDELKVTITGPGLHLFAPLKPGVSYAPCFSCGCTTNRLKIRPLDSLDEEGRK